MRKLSIQLEEQLLWKLLQFAGMGKEKNMQEQVTADEENPRKALVAATSVETKRYYFGTLKINTSRVILSMLTASKLSSDLSAIKQAMSVPLELKSQAAKILGSVDFLGNPLGLFNDVTEGLSGLIKDGNVGGLFKNVTHGLSNSTAKVASSLSDTVGNLNMDNVHNERRERIRNQGQSGGSHLVAGVKGFGVGIFGALTSLVTQPVQGFKEEGVEGFLTGIGKGVVGTVTKPVAGVLDLASGAANALKDTSASSSKMGPPRVRRPRCCHGPGRLLQAYNKGQAKSQELLHKLNRNRHSEYFIALEQLRSGKEDSLLAMITSSQVYFMRRGAHNPDNVILQVRYQDLQLCFVVKSDERYYIELVLNDKSSKELHKRPQVRCDKEYTAQRVSSYIIIIPINISL
ncbi:hypothetical protein FSP39_010303 [Pinctada imbricata]|uniref:Intermembrane lipid transfer protein VPS13-like C-terminal domain-containing protein n=1 Tax=Pinctada imbricata TaxID=66713 RepID=A0AA88YDU4_PINIB|nr:hypothetical protein FSP39_010303 [Pinctada imbricata]